MTYCHCKERIAQSIGRRGGDYGTDLGVIQSCWMAHRIEYTAYVYRQYETCLRLV